jgi:hypothetical protein
VGPRSSCGDELVSYLARERQVGERVAVEMAELPLPEPEVGPAEAMRGPLDPWPRHHRCGDPLANAEFFVQRYDCQRVAPGSYFRPTLVGARGGCLIARSIDGRMRATSTPPACSRARNPSSKRGSARGSGTRATGGSRGSPRRTLRRRGAGCSIVRVETGQPVKFVRRPPPLHSRGPNQPRSQPPAG